MGRVKRREVQEALEIVRGRWGGRRREREEGESVIECSSI